MRVKSFIFITTLLALTSFSHGQDTSRYHSLIAEKLIAESIELYPDSTFKWENIYDLNWSEYGKYSLKGNRLTLRHFLYNYPVSVNLKDSLKYLHKPFKTTSYEIENGKMYQFDDNKNKITSKKDKSIRTKWSWLYRHKHDYYFKNSDTKL